jgi:hypothetical protein
MIDRESQCRFLGRHQSNNSYKSDYIFSRREEPQTPTSTHTHLQEKMR